MFLHRLSICLSMSAPAFFITVGESCAQGPASPVDPGWLLSECAGGALVHHADGRLYLTELEQGESRFLANGNQPEFSPDGRRIAWIDGTRAKGRLRAGDPTTYVIAKDVVHAGGVHWLSDGELALVLERHGKKAWCAVGLEGSERELVELTRLGTGGYECDVKLGVDGVWSYIADQAWKTSDGHSGSVTGTCSVSLSPDGKTATSLHNPHKQCDLTPVRDGGITSTIWWRYAGGYDNHRFASSDPRFIIAVDEHTRTMVVMTIDGEQVARVGTLGHAEHGMYGDWTSRPAIETAPWLPPAPDPKEADHSAQESGMWGEVADDTIFLWDTAQSSNTLAHRPPEASLCRLETRGQARWGSSYELMLQGGWALAEEDIVVLLLSDLARSREGTLELVLAADQEDSQGVATIASLAGLVRLEQTGDRLRARVGYEPHFDLGGIRANVPAHVAIVWSADEVRVYRDGEELERRGVTGALFHGVEATVLAFGANEDGSADWSGWIEGIALHRAALDPSEIRSRSRNRHERLVRRVRPEQRAVTGILLEKRVFPRPDVYPNTLVVFDYRVSGERISVAHWAVLDGDVQGPIQNRREGAVYELRLERWTDHSELHSFKLVGSAEIEVSPWFDAGPSSGPH